MCYNTAKWPRRGGVERTAVHKDDICTCSVQARILFESKLPIFWWYVVAVLAITYVRKVTPEGRHLSRHSYFEVRMRGRVQA